MKTPDHIKTESAMLMALRDHFHSPEYALLPQVRNGTGFARTVRTADAIVMGLWPSRGIYLHGIEIKVSRADWLKEKDAPEKAEEICRFCDFWWLAAGNEKIVQEGELPPDWGLLVPSGPSKLRVAKSPTKRADPTPITRLFLASLLRKVCDAAPVFTDVDKAIKEQVDKQVEAIQKGLERSQDHHTQRRLKDYDTLRANVEKFEKESGIHIDRYGDYFSSQIGEAVRAIRQAGNGSVLTQYARAEKLLASAADDLRKQREALEAVWALKQDSEAAA